METDNLLNWMMIATFIIGYFFITIEHYVKVNKATVALMMAIICWIIQFFSQSHSLENNTTALNHHLSEISQILFFIMGALAIVECMSQHRGFDIIANLIKIQSKKNMLWVIIILTFFLSCVLDNLTTTVVMTAFLKKLMDKNEDRLILGGAVVIAANAGGAWTPIGDVTTTMLWIGGQVTTLGVIKALFLPSVACGAISGTLLARNLKGNFDNKFLQIEDIKLEPYGKFIFILGIILVIFVPVFKMLTGLPPFMGVLFALSILWFVTDIVHRNYHEREHLLMPHVFTRIDLPGVFFFLGILLCVDALYTSGLLHSLSLWLDATFGNIITISMLIGLASAVVDNVPLVAAAMGMYDLGTYPTDHPIWQMIAFCAGTGGSILLIGSAAGVVYMGMEKVDFLWYARKIGIPAFAGFLGGLIVYQLGVFL